MLNHKGTQEIVTERLLLRKYRTTDSENMFKNYANMKEYYRRHDGTYSDSLIYGIVNEH